MIKVPDSGIDGSLGIDDGKRKQCPVDSRWCSGGPDVLTAFRSFTITLIYTISAFVACCPPRSASHLLKTTSCGIKSMPPEELFLYMRFASWSENIHAYSLQCFVFWSCCVLLIFLFAKLWIMTPKDTAEHFPLSRLLHLQWITTWKTKRGWASLRRDQLERQGLLWVWRVQSAVKHVRIFVGGGGPGAHIPAFCILSLFLSIDTPSAVHKER